MLGECNALENSMEEIIIYLMAEKVIYVGA
jgi:hypothetical protein